MKTAWRRTTQSLDARSSGGSSSVDVSRRRRPRPGRLPAAPANHSQSAPRRVLPRRPCYWAYGRNRRLRAINVRPDLESGSVPRGTRRAQYGAHLAPKKRAPGAAWICRSGAFAIFDRAGGPSRRHRTMTIPRPKPQSGWLRERVSGTPRSRVSRRPRGELPGTPAAVPALRRNQRGSGAAVKHCRRDRLGRIARTRASVAAHLT